MLFLMPSLVMHLKLLYLLYTFIFEKIVLFIIVLASAEHMQI